MKSLLCIPLLLCVLCSCAGVEKGLGPARDRLVPERSSRFEGREAASVIMTGRNAMRYEELENGLRFLVIEMPDSPVSFAAIGFRVGGRYEPETRAGISHLLEHLLFSGGENEGADAIRGMGGSVNALTDYELTYYHFTVLPNYFDDSLAALCDMLLDPHFDGRDLKREREVVLEELARGRNDTRAMALSSLVRRVFPASPLKNLVIGTERSVRRVTLGELYRFHGAYYNPSNMIVVCAGPVDPKKTVRTIHERFGSSARTPAPVAAFEPPVMAVNELTRKIPVDQAFYVHGALAPGMSDDDFYAMEVLDLVLGSGKNSRLQRRITAEEGLTEEIFTFRHTLSDTGIWTLMCSTDPGDIVKIKRLVTEEIALIREGGLSEQEILDAKHALIARELIRLDSPKTLAVFALQNLLFRNEVISVEEHIDRIDKITRSDVREAARTYLSEKNSVSVSLLPAPVTERLFLMLKIAITGEI